MRPRQAQLCSTTWTTCNHQIDPNVHSKQSNHLSSVHEMIVFEKKKLTCPYAKLSPGRKHWGAVKVLVQKLLTRCSRHQISEPGHGEAVQKHPVGSIFILLVKSCPMFLMQAHNLANSMLTSSTAQGGGESFKNKKPIGEVRYHDAWMAERANWRKESWLRFWVSSPAPSPSPFPLPLPLPLPLPFSLSLSLSLSPSPSPSPSPLLPLPLPFSLSLPPSLPRSLSLSLVSLCHLI